jgi:prophage antirepressor-like protein
MENQVIKQFEDKNIRIISQENGEIWFVGKDACNVLGIKNHKQTLERLDSDERGWYKTDTPGGKQSSIIISESGLYKIIFQSNKPNAKSFTNWVTKEVLPSIRKYGKYESNVITAHERILRIIKEKEEEYEMVKGEKLGLAKRERELRQEIKYLINSNPAQLQLFN